MKPIYFCPNCHGKVIPPKMFKNINVTGSIKITCGNCNKDGKGNPRGVVIIKPNKKEDELHDSVEKTS